jgi:mono/diheme cytochrome c family protein
MRAVRIAVVTALLATGIVASAQTSSVRDGVYAVAQAERGRTLYADRCVSCHGELSAFVPEMAALLADHTFRNRWQGRPLGELFQLISDEMPQDAPGTLSPQEAADLVSVILSGNRLPAGDVALPGDLEQLNQIRFDP